MMFFKSFTRACSFCTLPELKSKAYNYYHTTLRQANQRSEQKGIFTQSHLLQIMKLAKPSDSQLMFEAYFNFIGHLTFFESRTVDKLIKRGIELSKEDSEYEPKIAEEIFNIYRYQQYFRYYPHFDVTEECICFYSDLPTNFERFLLILRKKPFVKLNRKLGKLILDKAQNEMCVNQAIKLLSSRSNHGIIDISPKQMLGMICDKLDKVETIQPLKLSKDYRKFLDRLEEEVAEETEKINLAIANLLFEEGGQKAEELMEGIQERERLQKIKSKLQTTEQQEMQQQSE